MLQNTNWNNRDDGPLDFRPGPAVSLAEVWAVLAFVRRNVPLISLAVFAALGIAIFYLLIAVPTYTAKAVLIVNAKGNVVEATAVSTVVESQIEIMRSESIASAVIEKHGLAQDPEYATSHGGGMISRLLGWSKPETEASAARYAVEWFERKLSAKRVGRTYLVELTFDDRDPDRAAQILNDVAEKYITHQVDKGGLQDDKWVKDRLSELSGQASAAQKALDDYGKNRNDSADSTATMDRLVAAVESSKNAYNNFRHVLRKIEATQQQSSPVFEATLLTGASPPLRATSPRPRNVLGIAIVGGLLLGVAIAVLRDLVRGIRANELEHRPGTEETRIDRPFPDAVRPSYQSEASARGNISTPHGFGTRSTVLTDDRHPPGRSIRAEHEGIQAP